MAGLVLQLILLAPLPDREVTLVFAASLSKELAVMNSVKRATTLDFTVFFGNYSAKLHDSLTPNPAMAIRIHAIIDTWIESLQTDVLFPRVGSKTVSQWTARNLRNVDPTYVRRSRIGVTPIDLECVYHMSGYEVDGPCELRQKWYLSNLQPRTYFAQGGDAYHTSKYLSQPFTDLCDLLPATNRRSRVRPSRIVIRDPTYDVAYYDLSSFTSNLHVQCDFMYRLAHYCKEEYVRILDSRDGIITANLGELIHDYTTTNLSNPKYVTEVQHNDPTLIRYHNVAGFLGVYGNIATATFLHGIVISMKHSHFDEYNVAGDDGLDVTRDVLSTLELVGTMGVVHSEKTFRESEGCCIHLKRPIVRYGDRLYHGDLVTWPSLEPVQTEYDTRYPYLQRQSKRDRRDALASSITAFLRKLSRITLTADHIDIVDTFLSNLYRTYDLPRAGCVPQITRVNSGFVPAYERRYIGLDPITNTILCNYVNIATVPSRGIVPWTDCMFLEDAFQCNSTKLLNHLVVLGYLEQEKVSMLVFGYEGQQRLLKEYMDPDPPIYDYRVVRKLPEWCNDFLTTLNA